MQSYGGDPKTVDSDDGATTDLGGSVRYSVGSSEDSTAITITFSNAAPGDSVSFDMSADLMNTINVYYSGTMNVTHDGTGTGNPFTVTGLGTMTEFAVSDETREIVSNRIVTVSMSTDAGNEWQDTTFSLTIMFQALQANAPLTSSVTETIAVGPNTITVGSPSETYDSASISFNATDEDILTITALDTSDADYTLTGTSLLAGVDVSSSQGEDALMGTSVTVTFRITGDLSGTELTIYHDGTPMTTQPDISKTYDENTGITTV